jgi:RNA polymerase sigma factor (sigma-70 family)
MLRPPNLSVPWHHLTVVAPRRESLPSRSATVATAPQELRAFLQATDPVARDEAWGQFVNRFSPLLLHTARSVSREPDRVMDAYAYILEKLRDEHGRRLRHYAEDPGSQFTTWLVVVARRLCHDYLRQRYGRFREHPSFNPSEHAGRRRLVDLIAEEIDQAAPLADPAETPDAQVRRRDQSAALQASLAQLTPAERLLLTLRFEHDRPAREIARLLHYPTTFHVYRAINSALKELRRSLTRQGISDSEP